jgi:hypothetical protein
MIAARDGKSFLLTPSSGLVDFSPLADLHAFSPTPYSDPRAGPGPPFMISEALAVVRHINSLWRGDRKRD